MELVDILLPPTFEKSGVVKPRSQAIKEGDWIGTFNLWIVQTEPVPALIYQLRSPGSTWAPNKLDVTAGGHYTAGETIFDGLREVREELGKEYPPEQLTYVGRKLHVSPDIQGYTRHNVVEIFLTTDNSSIETYILEKAEVSALVVCPLAELIKAHTQKFSFMAKGLDAAGKTVEVKVSQGSFPYNWDNYHFKMALLAERYLQGYPHLGY